MNEQKYTDLVAKMPVAYALHEMLYNEKGEAVDYRFLDVNAAFVELTGLAAEVVVGKSLLEVMPDAESYWIQKYADCVRTGECMYYENYSQSLKKYYQVVAYKYAERQFVTIFLDISDRKEDFRKAEEVASFYQTITENAFDGVVILNKELKFTYISPNTYKLFGYDPSDMLKLVPTELTHPDDLPYVLSELDKTIENPNYKNTIEYRFRNKNGEWIWIEVKFTNFFHHSQINGLIINFKVINDRKIREQELKQSEANLTATLRHTNYSIWNLDTEYHIIYANDRFLNDYYQSFGVKLEIGRSIVDFLPEPIKYTWINIYDKALANNTFIDEVHLNIAGIDIYVEVSATPIVVDGIVTGASFYGQNITDRKVAELKLVQNSEYLNKVLNASNQFVKSKSKDVDFNELTEILRQIAGSKYAVFNRLYADYSKTISMSGLENTKEIIMKYLNIDITNKKWNREEAFESKWMHNKLTLLPDIGSILFTNFNATVVKMIVNAFNIGTVAILSIEGNEQILGNLIFIYEKGKSIQNTELIEIFTYQLGQYLERLNADDALNQKISEMERFHKLTVNRELNMIELKKEVNELLRKMGQEEKYRIVM